MFNPAVMTLCTGSKGNSIYVTNGRSALLIDAGRSASFLCGELKKLPKSSPFPSAIIVTHDHSDHISAVYQMQKRFDLKVFLHEKNIVRICRSLSLDTSLVGYFEDGKPFAAADIPVLPFPISHDAPNTSGFRVNAGNMEIGVMTDTGVVTETAFEALNGVELAILESNHDVSMLQNGSYPPLLKRRILSKYGHLSNEASADFALKLYESGTKKFLLSHLSRDNNLEILALGAYKKAFSEFGAEDYILGAAPKDCGGVYIDRECEKLDKG